MERPGCRANQASKSGALKGLQFATAADLRGARTYNRFQGLQFLAVSRSRKKHLRKKNLICSAHRETQQPVNEKTKRWFLLAKVQKQGRNQGPRTFLKAAKQ